MTRPRELRILVADGEPLMRDFLREFLGRAGYPVDVTANGREALMKLGGREYALVLADSRLRAGDGSSLLKSARDVAPATKFVVMTAVATVEDTIQAMRLGASDFVTKPLAGEQVEQLLARVLGGEDAARTGDNRPAGSGARPTLVGESRQIKEMYALIRLAASTDATVLISGETGTGKELVARAIHERSSRSAKRFVRLNCAALPESLYESELFGHERGAFTGALQLKKGRFELAHGGTLLMDEISEIGWSVQAKLLRVLQEKEFERVGGCSTIRVDARIVATTNKNLAIEIREERFRSDLYYRLSVFPITVPPLRDRQGDIPLLTEHFLGIHCEKNGLRPKRVTRSAMELMLQYGWPGNVRQIENCLERAALVSAGSTIGPEHLAELTDTEVPDAGLTDPDSEGVITSIRDMETALLLKALDEAQGNRTVAAGRLGITTRTLRNKLHRIGMMDYRKTNSRGRKKLPAEEETVTVFPAGEGEGRRGY